MIWPGTAEGFARLAVALGSLLGLDAGATLWRGDERELLRPIVLVSRRPDRAAPASLNHLIHLE